MSEYDCEEMLGDYEPTIPTPTYKVLVATLYTLDEKQLLELFHDINDVACVERIADCAYQFVEAKEVE